MKKHIVFCLLNLTLVIVSKAQTFDAPALIISAGPTFQNIKSESFNQFQKNYIAYYANSIDKTKYAPGTGFYFQINIAPYFNTEYTTHSSKKEILFKNGDKMGFNFKSRQWRLNFGFGIGELEDDQICFKPELGLGFGRNHLECNFQTSNSQAMDLLLDGKYRDGNIFLNLGLAVHVKPSDSPIGFKAYLRQNWTILAFEMTDDSKPFLEDRIPIDYVAWRNTPKGDYLGDAVKGNFRFFEVGLGLSLIFADL
ncbi:MAG: hypothetical protein Q8K70_12635 [Bacteroidota bacterium]|nr:hypothetical protein [Bacteroidota bacterium]